MPLQFVIQPDCAQASSALNTIPYKYIKIPSMATRDKHTLWHRIGGPFAFIYEGRRCDVLARVG